MPFGPWGSTHQGTLKRMIDNDELARMAAHYLHEGEEREALSLLCQCEVVFLPAGDYATETGYNYSLPDRVKLAGGRTAHEVLAQADHDLTRQIYRALEVAVKTLNDEAHLHSIVASYRKNAHTQPPSWVLSLQEEIPSLSALEAHYDEVR